MKKLIGIGLLLGMLLGSAVGTHAHGVKHRYPPVFLLSLKQVEPSIKWNVDGLITLAWRYMDRGIKIKGCSYESIKQQEKQILKARGIAGELLKMQKNEKYSYERIGLLASKLFKLDGAVRMAGKFAQKSLEIYMNQLIFLAHACAGFEDRTSPNREQQARDSARAEAIYEELVSMRLKGDYTFDDLVWIASEIDDLIR